MIKMKLKILLYVSCHYYLSIQAKFYTAAGNTPISSVCEKSGEPFPEGLKGSYRDDVQEISTGELWKLQIKRAEFAKKYLDTWNNTATRTKPGRPIDAIIRYSSLDGVNLVLLRHIQLFYMTTLKLELLTLLRGIY
jgi:hypothetical protein